MKVLNIIEGDRMSGKTTALCNHIVHTRNNNEHHPLFVINRNQMINRDIKKILSREFDFSNFSGNRVLFKSWNGIDKNYLFDITRGYDYVTFFIDNIEGMDNLFISNLIRFIEMSVKYFNHFELSITTNNINDIEPLFDYFDEINEYTL